MKNHHFLLMSLPAQGHVNPTLQLAKCLARTGAHVTYATTIYGLSTLKNLPNGLSYASFSDGYDARKNVDPMTYLDDLKRLGSQDLTKMIQTYAKEGQPVTLLIYSMALPWAAAVACELHVRSAFLCVQSATAFAIYHKYFDSRSGIYNGIDDVVPPVSMKLPGLPSFSTSELPTVILPNDQYFVHTAPAFHEHIKNLVEDPKPCVLVNTFSELEEVSIRAVDKINVIPIGPLIPSAFSDGNDPTDKSFGADLFCSSKRDYLQWLDSKPERSVIYVSFGSLVVIKKEQKEEILHGLAETGRPFLWVIRPSEDKDEASKAAVEGGPKEDGIIVPWCSQMEVLSHQSLGCFMTHSGWNSTTESLVAGVPMVGCPQFSDQPTNAKMVEEVWGNGIKARANEDGVVEREEIKKCLDIVMGDGERGQEIRHNAVKWRGLALDSVKESGSSYNNLKMYLESLG